jgi:hypothetical protein
MARPMIGKEQRARLARIASKDAPTVAILYLWCPGCRQLHGPRVEGTQPWTWNGDLDAPTLSHSIKVTWENHATGKKHVCHSFMKGGTWQFLGDCTHSLAGQTVQLPRLPHWFVEGAEP